MARKPASAAIIRKGNPIQTLTRIAAKKAGPGAVSQSTGGRPNAAPNKVFTGPVCPWNMLRQLRAVMY